MSVILWTLAVEAGVSYGHTASSTGFRMNLPSLIFKVLVTVSSDPVVLSHCELARDPVANSAGAIACEITNTGTEPLSGVSFSSIARDENRAAPWSDQIAFPILIQGGIEPGETVKQIIRLPDVPARASLDTLVIEINELKAIRVK